MGLVFVLVFSFLGSTLVKAEWTEENKDSLPTSSPNPYEDMGNPKPWPQGMEPTMVVTTDARIVAEAKAQVENIRKTPETLQIPGLYQLTVWTYGDYSGTYARIACTNPAPRFDDFVNASIFTVGSYSNFIQIGWIKNGPNVSSPDKPGGPWGFACVVRGGELIEAYTAGTLSPGSSYEFRIYRIYSQWYADIYLYGAWRPLWRGSMPFTAGASELMAEVRLFGGRSPYSGLLPWGRNVDQKIWDGNAWNQWDTRYPSSIREDQPPFYQRVPYLYYYQYYWQYP